ncbi:MAG: hypothetical protein JST83_06605 [Bacteroidetes bacterium]|nr:hypothetical protein [Bacteroidota bacterium]
MDDLWKLNKHKVCTAAIWIIAVCFIVCILIFTGLSSLKDFPGITIQGIAYFVLFLTAIPTFILSVMYADLRYRGRLAAVLFAQRPLIQLVQLGFSKNYKNLGSKWLFTTVYWQGQINGFDIKVFTTKHIPGRILFKAYVKNQTIDKNRFTELTAQLSQKDITFDKASLVKSIPVKTVSNMELTEIQQALIDFTETLKQQNFIPDHI